MSYKRIYITTPDDLPKEKGQYFVCWSENSTQVWQRKGVWSFDPNNQIDIDFWMERVEYYLVETDLKEELTRVKESAINNQHGLNFPNELYIEATAIIMVCDHFLEYLTNKEK